MRTIKSGLITWAVLWVLCLAPIGNAQYRNGIVDSGTTITVRTNETIHANDSDGRVYSAVVEQDVKNRNGSVAIPRGSDVELIVRETSDDQLLLDLDSIMINGMRYGVQTDSNVVGSTEQKQGIGANKRTGKYVGGGAVLGAIIGGIAGGGKGAAIGAGAGAAAGAGAQVLTRGGKVEVPAESLLTFRLTQPLRAGVGDTGYLNNGVHYHSLNQDRFSTSSSSTYRQKAGSYSSNQGEVHIGFDKNITWSGPKNAMVYVQVDNEPEKLFAAGQSGTQEAPWILNGHVYTFILKDSSGNEIARDRQDLRRR
jgi:hypothetical protein